MLLALLGAAESLIPRALRSAPRRIAESCGGEWNTLAPLG